MQLVWIMFVAHASAQITTLSNAHYRVNNESKPFDAHDGSIQQFEKDGPYYYHAMGYGMWPVLLPRYGLWYVRFRSEGYRVRVVTD